MSNGTTIYAARRIITMNRNLPEATHVAVRDGRVLGVGDLDALAGWGDHTLDDRFAGKVLQPGFIEGHSHLMQGGMWRYAYGGCFPAVDPDSETHDGLRSIGQVLAERLQVASGLLLSTYIRPSSSSTRTMTRTSPNPPVG